MGQVTALIVRDPWGDVTSGYANRNGDGIVILLDFYMAKVRGLGQPAMDVHLVTTQEGSRSVRRVLLISGFLSTAKFQLEWAALEHEQLLEAKQVWACFAFLLK